MRKLVLLGLLFFSVSVWSQDCEDVLKSGWRAKVSRAWKTVKRKIHGDSATTRYPVRVLQAEIETLSANAQERLLFDLLPHLEPFAWSEFAETLAIAQPSARPRFYVSLRSRVRGNPEMSVTDRISRLLSEEDRRAANIVFRDHFASEVPVSPGVEYDRDPRLLLWDFWELPKESLSSKALLRILSDIPRGIAKGFTSHGFDLTKKRISGRLPYEDFLSFLEGLSLKTSVDLNLRRIPMDLLVTAAVLKQIGENRDLPLSTREQAFWTGASVLRESLLWESMTPTEQWRWSVFFYRLTFAAGA